MEKKNLKKVLVLGSGALKIAIQNYLIVLLKLVFFVLLFYQLS